jgi:GNAT superfamily N-acetyltransferase
VDPAEQRLGIGALLLQRMLRRAEADGTPAYLETDLERNLVFYGRVGFQVAGELELFGARIWRLRRPARAGGGDGIL